MINADNVRQVLEKSAAALRENSAYLIELDQQMGDGDLGITAGKIADALDAYVVDATTESDIGKLIMTAGMKINSAAPSTMGSLLAIGLMRAGKEAKGQTAIDEKALGRMLYSAVEAIQEKGKAKLGDKTLLDALIPSVNAFTAAITSGASLTEAGKKMLDAARGGLESSIPMRSKVGRASWVGDRTEGKIDPGCALIVCLLGEIIQQN